jgi:indole-3-glycerol phosphate synthase
MTILDRIIAYKRDEVAAARSTFPFADVEAAARSAPQPRGFERALRRVGAIGTALIAEIKKASPSKGLIRADFDAAAHARSYEAAGAACLSVLTDRPSFQGSPEDLKAARAAVALPILRKDFMIDPYQVAEARALGADCILIIMACLSDPQARELSDAARAFDLDVLVETHDASELDRALALGAVMIGVNNRDLRTFATDLATTERIATRLPKDRLLVAESGINTPRDIARLKAAGAGAFLVGESLMRAENIAAATRALLDPGAAGDSPSESGG